MIGAVISHITSDNLQLSLPINSVTDQTSSPLEAPVAAINCTVAPARTWSDALVEWRISNSRHSREAPVAAINCTVGLLVLPFNIRQSGRARLQPAGRDRYPISIVRVSWASGECPLFAEQI